MGISSPRLRKLLGEGTGIHTAREVGAVRAAGITLVEGDIASDHLCDVHYMGRRCGPVRRAEAGYAVAGKSRDLRFTHLSAAALVAAATAIEAEGLAIHAADDATPAERPEPDGQVSGPPS